MLNFIKLLGKFCTEYQCTIDSWLKIVDTFMNTMDVTSTIICGNGNQGWKTFRVQTNLLTDWPSLITKIIF